MSLSHRSQISICAAIGLAAAGTSLYVHYGLVTNSASSSFCDISQTVNCTQAYLSQYGEIGGIPVALVGVVYFALVLALASMAWKKPSGDSVPGYIFAISVPALAFIAYLAYASFFVLQTFCILCAISYLAVVAIAVLSWRATTFPLAALSQRASNDVQRVASSPLAVAVVVVLVAGAIIVARMFPSSTQAVTAATPPTFESLPAVSDEERGRLAKWWELQPRVDLPIDAAGAKVVVVKFNDYQCPPCRQTFQAYKPIFQKHGAQMKFVLKHFPLEPECNGAVSNVVHPAACEAAAAVNMARAKGTADRLEEWLFANQGPPLLTPDQVREAARTVAGITDFAAQYPQVIKDVRADAALGEKVKVTGTPTFFINGRIVKEILAPQYFNVLIELELQAH
jgi:uncharacterized membrane protein/protein-disulfide isomerase